MSVFGRSFGTSSTPETPPVFGGDEDEILDVRADRFSSRNIEGCRFEELKAARESLKQEYIRSGKILADGAQVSLENAIQMTGECLDMCPEFERHERWFQDNLADPFELIPGTSTIDHARCVKRFRRSAADTYTILPCDVRPPHVLVQTLDYLFHTLLPQYTILESHGFVRDRTRAIRKEFTLLNYRGIEAVQCHERIARYHILCASFLVGQERFNLQPELEQMRKTLQSLREYYTDLPNQCPNEAEFQAYYILSHLWQSEIATLAENLPLHIYNHPHVQLALRLQSLAQSATGAQERGFSHTRGALNAYTEFFRVLAEPTTPYLFAAILHLEFDVIRCNALMSMNKCLFDLPPHVSLVELSELLGMDDEDEVCLVLEYYGVSVEVVNGVKVARIGKNVVTQPDGKTKVTTKPFIVGQRVTIAQRPSRRFVNSKIGDAELFEILDGSYQGLAGLIPKPGGYVARPLVGPVTPAIPRKPQFPETPSFPTSQPALDTGSAQSKFSTPINTSSSFNTSAPAFTPTDGSVSAFGAQSNGPPVISAFNTGFSFLKPQPPKPNQSSSENSAPISSTLIPNKPVIQASNFSFIPQQTASAAPASSKFTDNSPSLFSDISKNIVAKPELPSVVIAPPVQDPAPSFITGFLPSLVPTFTTSSPKTQSPSAVSSVISFAARLFSNSSSDAKTPQPSESKQIHEPTAIIAPVPPQEPVASVIPSFTFSSIPTSQPIQKQQTLDSKPKSPPPPTPEELSVYTETLTTLMKTIATETIHTDETLHRPITDILVSEVVSETLQEIHSELVTELSVRAQEARDHDLMRTQKTAFRVWFRRARARALEREREREWRQEKAVWFYRNVLVGSGNTTGSSVWKPDVSRLLTGGLDHLREVPPPTQDSTYFKHLDIPALIFPSLYKKNHVAANRFNPDHLFWKLIVSTPSYIATPDTEYTDRITSLWMCSKFGAGGDGSGQQNRLREDAEGYRVDELLRMSLLDLQDPDTKRSGRRKTKNSVSLSVNVSHVQVRKEAEYPLKPNAEAVCSGTQAVLFLFSGAKVGRSREERLGWWEGERERLYSLLSALPVGSSVPLLLCYLPSDGLGVEEFERDVGREMNLGSVLTDNGGPVSALNVVVLGDGGQFDPGWARDVLKEAVVWLAESSAVQPILRCDVVKDVIEAQGIDAVRFAYHKMEQSVFDMDFSLDYKHHISTFNALIDIHNLQVKAISQVLSSIENESIPWPSLELSTAFASNPPIHWNNRQTQSSVKQLLETFLLPNMSEPTTLDQENPSFRILTLKRSYEAYIGKLAGTPILSNGTAVLSFVWNRIAVFERDLMNAPVSEYASTKKKNVVVFPFSSIGMSFVGDAVEALKTELERCGREITKSESVKSPWYSWKRVEAVLQEFEKNVDATVQKWEEQVLTPWNQVQESVKAAQKEQQRRRELDRKAAQAQSLTHTPQGYSTPIRSGSSKGKRPLSLSTSTSPGDSFAGFEFGTPIPKTLFMEGGSSGIGSAFSTPASQVPLHPKTNGGEAPMTEYAALKRRVSEALALSRQEIENSRRRLGQV